MKPKATKAEIEERIVAAYIRMGGQRVLSPHARLEVSETANWNAEPPAYYGDEPDHLFRWKRALTEVQSEVDMIEDSAT